MRMPWSSASYSASLFEALLKLIWSTYLSLAPLGEIITTPAPAPCCLFDPSKNISMSWTGLGGRCLHFCPLDQEVWEYLGFDCRWVFKLQVTGTELDVPFGDSASCSGVVEDVHEWLIRPKRIYNLCLFHACFV